MIVKRLRFGGYRFVWSTTDGGWGRDSIADDGFVHVYFGPRGDKLMASWTGAEFKRIDELSSVFAHGRLVASKEDS
jgi:hypothetical protein